MMPGGRRNRRDTDEGAEVRGWGPGSRDSGPGTGGSGLARDCGDVGPGRRGIGFRTGSRRGTGAWWGRGWWTWARWHQDDDYYVANDPGWCDNGAKTSAKW